MRADLVLFLHGALTMGCLVVAFVFARYYRLSRDRFFVFFGTAFLMFAAGWAMRAFIATATEHGHLVYLPRLLGFLLILAGIFDKNRGSRVI